MRFATTLLRGRPVFGLIEADNYHAAGDSILAAIPDLAAAIASGLERTAEDLREQGEHMPTDGLVFAPIIPHPTHIYCVGLNYQTHRDEVRHPSVRARPEHPTMFARFASTLIGHRAPIVKPYNSNVVDYEGELAVIIGKRGRRIARRDALAYVAGYSCFNDVSMRDWQMHGAQWIPGKNFPHSGALGPMLTTVDEVGPLDELRLRTILNGTVMQEAKLGSFIFDVPAIISYISGFCELQPGDVIATGTPGGVGFKRDPPVLLEPGKICEVVIDRVGHLINPVVAEPPP